LPTSSHKGRRGSMLALMASTPHRSALAPHGRSPESPKPGDRVQDLLSARRDGGGLICRHPRARPPKMPLSEPPALVADRADPIAIATPRKAVAGNPPMARASFAKGHCVSGTYTPSEQAADITRSLSFTRPGPVLGRFSVGGGNPKVADTNR